MNNICIHEENGITFVSVDGHELKNVTDYKIASSAHGEAELTLVVSAKVVQSEFEVVLAES